jgi:glutamate dehydrogenase
MLAMRAAGAVFIAGAVDIADLVNRCEQPLDRAAQTYYAVGARFVLDEMRAGARRLPVETSWQKQAAEAMIDDLYALQAEIAARILTSEHAAASDPVAAWCAAQTAALESAELLVRELRGAATPDLAMLLVTSRQLRHSLG